MKNKNEKAVKLFAAMFRRDKKGNRVYSDLEVHDMIALLMLQRQLEGIDFPESLTNVMGAFAARIGVGGPQGNSNDNLPELVKAYLAKNPLNKNLVKECMGLLK